MVQCIPVFLTTKGAFRKGTSLACLTYVQVVCPLQENNTKLTFGDGEQMSYDNLMDRWILSFTQSLIMFVKDEMNGKWPNISTSTTTFSETL